MFCPWRLSSSASWAAPRSRVTALLFVLLLVAPSRGAEWEQIERLGVRLCYPADEAALGGHILAELVTGRGDVARELGGVELVPVEAYLATSADVFRKLTNDRIPHWGVGVAFPESRTLVLRYQPGRTDELSRTARHELSHILLHAKLPDTRIPVWFNEGVATWVAREWRFHESIEVVVAALRSGLIPLSEIDFVLGFDAVRAHLAYTESQLAVLYLIEQGGPGSVAAVVEALSEGAPFDVALFRVLGVSLAAFESGFRDYVGSRFGPMALVTSPEAVWVFASALIIVVYAAVRIRNRRRVAAWEEEDDLDALPLRLRLRVRRAADEENSWPSG